MNTAWMINAGWSSMKDIHFAEAFSYLILVHTCGVHIKILQNSVKLRKDHPWMEQLVVKINGA